VLLAILACASLITLTQLRRGDKPWSNFQKLWKKTQAQKVNQGQHAIAVEPTITWQSPAPITHGTPLSTEQLNATSSIDGSFAYSPGIGTIPPAGTTTLIAFFTPRDDKKYKATTKEVELIVNPAKAEPKQPSQLSPPLLEAQFSELHQIDDFIGRKTETALRETFDLPKMLKFNIRLTRRTLAPQLVSPSESEELDAYFRGGQALVDARFVRVTRTNNKVRADFIPGKIGILNLSTKYLTNRAQLAKYYSSPLLPSGVIESLKMFDKALQDNSTLMLESLNDSLASDPRNIFENDNESSNWWSSATNLYWQHFIQLKPKADKVNTAIRSALGVK
jgi:hypothetical protein